MNRKLNYDIYYNLLCKLYTKWHTVSQIVSLKKADQNQMSYCEKLCKKKRHESCIVMFSTLIGLGSWAGLTLLRMRSPNDYAASSHVYYI